MKYEDMESLISAEFTRIRELRSTKGREYAGEEDTLADFKEVAEEAGIAPLQVWATYVKKHQRAIDTYIREGHVKSEAIEDRIRDVIVYHLLLLGLIQDSKPNLKEALAALDVEQADPPNERVAETDHPPKCGAIGEVEQHHSGRATICCELEQDHQIRYHYGRTVEGHGYQWPVDGELTEPIEVIDG